jgi:hypothetical protein
MGGVLEVVMKETVPVLLIRVTGNEFVSILY